MKEHLPHGPTLVVPYCTPEMLAAGATAIEQFSRAYPPRQLAGAVYTAMERARDAHKTKPDFPTGKPGYR
jgi:hypothetical protein